MPSGGSFKGPSTVKPAGGSFKGPSGGSSAESSRGPSAESSGGPSGGLSVASACIRYSFNTINIIYYKYYRGLLNVRFHLDIVRLVRRYDLLILKLRHILLLLRLLRY